MEIPNILLLTIDTLRADMLGCYGYPRPITPNLDKLATRSVRFEQAITGGSWTQAAFPVMLTSSNASMYGGCLGYLSSARPSPIETLAENGYETVGFSSSPLLSKDYGYHRGFKKFNDLIPGETDPSLRHFKGGERLLRLPFVHHLARLLGKRTRPARLYVSAEEITDQACDWLDKSEKPFFGWLHYMDVHWPYHREEKLVTPSQIAQAWNDIAHLYRVNWKNDSITTEQKAHYLNLYEQAIEYTDAQVGRLLDKLDESGLAQNTMIIIVADHGEEFLERGQWGHFEVNLHDEILRVPLIIHLPGHSEGKTIRRQVRTLDIMPTVLDLCALQAPQGVEGKSLVDLWSKGEDAYPPQISISEMWRDHWHIIAVRTETFKYIWNSRQPNEPGLYNLNLDPAEKNNVLAQYSDEARRFQTVVEQHLQRGTQTAPSKPVAVPDMDEKMIRRLRDLGYVE
jgi:arylsulfatase A-like enzyme